MHQHTSISINMHQHTSIIYIYIYLSTSLPTYLSIHLSIYPILSIYLSISMYMCIYIYIHTSKIPYVNPMKFWELPDRCPFRGFFRGPGPGRRPCRPPGGAPKAPAVRLEFGWLGESGDTVGDTFRRGLEGDLMGLDEIWWDSWDDFSWDLIEIWCDYNGITWDAVGFWWDLVLEVDGVRSRCRLTQQYGLSSMLEN